MIRYLLDTDHLSLWGRGHQRVLARFSAIPLGEVAITIITAEEHLRGRFSQIRNSLPGLPVLLLTGSCAKRLPT